MASYHEKTAQEVLNDLNSTGQHTKSEQEVGNEYKSYASQQYSLQELFCAKASVGQHSASEQEALFAILKTPLSLTGTATRYSVQELLNLAEVNELTLDDLF